jgi:hypothetical protein
LKNNKVVLEMFATSWLLTLFTRVVDFGLIYELWEIFLFERDKYFIFYFSVALLKNFRTELMKMDSIERIIKFASEEIKIKEFNTLCNVYYESVNVRSNTPLSFPILISKLGLFDPSTIISNEEL